MGKFRAGFVKEIKEEQKREAEQEKLHRKHDIEDKNIVVVERSNVGKFLIRYGIGGIRLSVTALLFGLATLGAMALLYPEIREVLLKVLEQIFRDMEHMLV